MKRDAAVLPMPSFGGTGITGTLSMPERLEAATTAARETAEDRERLVLENARLRALLGAGPLRLAEALTEAASRLRLAGHSFAERDHQEMAVLMFEWAADATQAGRLP